MKIYLSGNTPLLRDREIKTMKKMRIWRRMISFYFLELVEKSNLLNIKNYENK